MPKCKQQDSGLRRFGGVEATVPSLPPCHGSIDERCTYLFFLSRSIVTCRRATPATASAPQSVRCLVLAGPTTTTLPYCLLAGGEFETSKPGSEKNLAVNQN